MSEIEKQIEEMASVMCSSYKSKKGCKTCPTNWCYAEECATMAYCNGYRNVKDKVLLSKEELNMLIGNIEKASEIKEEELKQVRKKMIKEIFDYIESALKNEEPSYTIEIDVIRNIMKELTEQHGVDVEENEQR